MKTYTRDEIKQIMIDRPGVEVRHPTHGFLYRLDDQFVLRFHNPEIPHQRWIMAESGLCVEDGYTIPADNETPAKLPESVTKAIDTSGVSFIERYDLRLIVTLLWAETVKLVEASKK